MPSELAPRLATEPGAPTDPTAPSETRPLETEFSLLTQPTNETIDLTKVIEHVHADGRLESAKLGDIPKLCTALANITLRELLVIVEHDDAAHRVAERAKTKRLAEKNASEKLKATEPAEKKATEKIMAPDKNDKAEQIFKAQIETVVGPIKAADDMDTEPPAKPATDPLNEILIDIAWRQQDLDKLTVVNKLKDDELIENPQSIKRAVQDKPSKPVVAQAKHSPVISQTKPNPSLAKKTKPEARAVGQSKSKFTNQSPLLKSVSVTAESPPEPASKSELLSLVEEFTIDFQTGEVLGDNAEIVDQLPIVESFDIETAEDFEDSSVIENFSMNIGVDAAAEAIIEAEVQETFDQIMALETVSENEVDFEISNDDTLENVDDTIVDDEATTEIVMPNLFQEFIESQPPVAEVKERKTIQAEAEDRTLMETFVQLAAALNELSASAETEQHGDKIAELIKIQLLFTEIHEELNDQYANGLEKIKPPQITLEITSKLLELLRALGYQNAQEALMEFVSKYNLEFLLQAVRYFYQLTNEDNRQEFLFHRTTTHLALDKDDTVATRLGRAIINLVTTKKEALKLAVAD